MGEIIESKEGVRFRTFGPQDVISRSLRTVGEYDPVLAEISGHVIRHKAGNVVDIGAHIGTYCLPLAKSFRTLRFTAFEVQPRAFSLLEQNIALNGLTNVHAVCCGLSDRMEEISATIPDYAHEANTGGFSLDADVRSNGYEVRTVAGKQTFNLKPLDSFALADILLIKLDVEGMELKVLQGAGETLKRNKFPPVLFEAWTIKPFYVARREMLLEHMRMLGYRITPVGENNFAQHVSRKDNLKLIF